MKQLFIWAKNELKQGKTLISYGGMRIGGHASSFFVPVILAMKFSPNVFGIYSLAMMIVYFFNSALIMSSGKPAIIFGDEEIRETQRINITLTSRTILLLLSLFIFIAFIFFGKQQIASFTGLTNSEVWLLLLVFVGKTVESFFSNMFMTLKKRVLEAGYFLTVGFFTVVYIVIIYLFFEITLQKVFFIFFIAPIISIIFFVSKIEFKRILPLSYNRKNLLNMTDFTKWMIFGGTGVYLLNWGDNIILRYFVSMDDIGVYNLGYQFFKGTIMAMAIVKMYFLPFISQHIDNPEKIKNYLSAKRNKLFFLGIALLGGAYVLMPYFVTFVYKAHYREAAQIFRILVIGSAFSLYSGFYDPIFDSMKRYKFLQILTVACVAVNLTLDYFLISKIGFTGAAVATSITYFIMAAAKEIYFRKCCMKYFLLV